MTVHTVNVIDANEGQSKSGSGARYNAVTHGLTTKVAVLPNEDLEAFREKVQGFKDSLQTRTPLEDDLAQKAAEASWRMSRASRAEVARITRSTETDREEAEYREEDDAMVLWERLFANRQGPAELYGAKPYYHHLRPRTSVPEPGVSNDPDSPDRLVADLERTRAGCRLLLKGWADLGSLIETRQGWGSYDKFRCSRLMGRQPLKVFSEPEVTEMFLACYAIAPLYQNAYQELRCELEEGEFNYLFAVMCQKELEAITPADATAGRAVLRRIVDNATERLRALEARHQQVADNRQRLQPDALAVEDTKAGEGIRRLQAACNRSMYQNLDAIHRGRRNEATGWGRTRQERDRKREERGGSSSDSRVVVNPGDIRLVLDEEGNVQNAWSYTGNLEEAVARFEAERGPQSGGPSRSLRRELAENDFPRVPDYARWKEPAADHATIKAATMGLTAQGDPTKCENSDLSVVSGQWSVATPRCQALADGASAIEEDAAATMGLTAQGDRAKNQNKDLSVVSGQLSVATPQCQAPADGDAAAGVEHDDAATMELAADRVRAKNQNCDLSVVSGQWSVATPQCQAPADRDAAAGVEHDDAATMKLAADGVRAKNQNKDLSVVSGQWSVATPRCKAPADGDAAAGVEHDDAATMELATEGVTTKNQIKPIKRQWDDAGSGDRRELGRRRESSNQERLHATLNHSVMQRQLMSSITEFEGAASMGTKEERRE